jgi:hypothetical protein
VNKANNKVAYPYGANILGELKESDLSKGEAILDVPGSTDQDLKSDPDTQNRLRSFSISIVNDHLFDLPAGGKFEVDILTFSGKTLHSKVLSSMPAIPALNNTLFEVSFGLNSRVSLSPSKIYARARYTTASD